MTIIPHKTAQKSTPVSATTFTGKEKDAETGFSYFGARYYDSDLSGLFLSVDPMADKYPNISPYAYCAWNPVGLIDPNGDTIKNGYEMYKDVNEDILYFQNLISKTSDNNVIKEYRTEIERIKANHKNYQKINDLIENFKKANYDEYQQLNNLKCNDTPINIIIGLSPLYSDEKDGTVGSTYFKYKVNGNHVEGIRSSTILITIFRNGFADGFNGVGTLANEFGDALFAAVCPQRNYETINLPYKEKPTSKFSYDYEEYIVKPYKKGKPNPLNY